MLNFASKWCLKHFSWLRSSTSVCICDFTLYLFNDHKVQMRTIECQKSVVAFILKRASGYDLSECTVAADMICSFARATSCEVQCDLSVVLCYLQWVPFAPGTRSTKNLTLKTVFFFAPALCKRRSDIYVLQRASALFAGDCSSAKRYVYKQNTLVFQGHQCVKVSDGASASFCSRSSSNAKNAHRCAWCFSPC